MNNEQFCAAFIKAFPNKPESEKFACDNTNVWIRVIDGRPTTGESCFINGLEVVDYYNDYCLTCYDFGILDVVRKFADDNGFEAQLQDPGTVKFYPK